MKFVAILFSIIVLVLFLTYKLGDDNTQDNIGSALCAGIIVFCIFFFGALLYNLAQS
jgi:chromate transport protein ChrA